MDYRPNIDRVKGRSNTVKGLAAYTAKEELWDKPENLNCSICKKFVRDVSVRKFTVERLGATICWKCQNINKHEQK